MRSERNFLLDMVHMSESVCVCVCVYLGITKIEIDCFGMTNMQNTIRLRGETGADLQRKEKRDLDLNKIFSHCELTQFSFLIHVSGLIVHPSSETIIQEIKNQ